MSRRANGPWEGPKKKVRETNPSSVSKMVGTVIGPTVIPPPLRLVGVVFTSAEKWA